MKDYEKIVKRVQCLYLNDEQYSVMIEKLSSYNLIDKDDTNLSLAIGFNLQGIPYIFCRDEISNYPVEYQTIIVAHEAAHAIALISDEEEADRWALDALVEEAQDILKSLWKSRHGHEYKEKENENDILFTS